MGLIRCSGWGHEGVRDGAGKGKGARLGLVMVGLGERERAGVERDWRRNGAGGGWRGMLGESAGGRMSDIGAAKEIPDS